MSSSISLPTLVDVLDATQLAMDVSGGHTWKMALFDDTLVIDPESWTAYGVAPFNAGEAAGGGYSAGGETLSGVVFAVQAGTGRARYTTNPVSILNVTDDFRYLLHYDDTLAGNNGLFVCDLGAPVSAVAETVTFTPATNGWWRLRGARP